MDDLGVSSFEETSIFLSYLIILINIWLECTDDSNMKIASRVCGWHITHLTQVPFSHRVCLNCQRVTLRKLPENSIGLRTHLQETLIKMLKTRAGWWLSHPSEKYEFVSWDNDIPNVWKII